MNFLRLQLKRLRFVRLGGVVLMMLFYYPQLVNAENGWFKKAKDLFGMGTKEDSNGEKISFGNDEIIAGLKEALTVGTSTIVKQLGQADGFNTDPAIHIPLPENFTTIQKALNKVGMSSMLDDLELRMNRAAEAAVPKTKDLFLQSIKEMTFEDAVAIYKGSDDAATKYLQNKMSDPIAKAMRPIVEKSLSEVGAMQVFDNVMGKYRSLPFVPDISADMTSHVINKGMKGIFHYLAIQEAAIREDPAKQATDLLKRIFSASQR